MNLTAEQIKDVVSVMKAKAAQASGPIQPIMVIRQWIQDNGLQGKVLPPQVMQGIRRTNPGRFISIQVPSMLGRICTNFCRSNDLTVEMCDSVIAALQDALVEVQAKKSELQS